MASLACKSPLHLTLQQTLLLASFFSPAQVREFESHRRRQLASFSFSQLFPRWDLHQIPPPSLALLLPTTHPCLPQMNSSPQAALSHGLLLLHCPRAVSDTSPLASSASSCPQKPCKGLDSEPSLRHCQKAGCHTATFPAASCAPPTSLTPPPTRHLPETLMCSSQLAHHPCSLTTPL